MKFEKRHGIIAGVVIVVIVIAVAILVVERSKGIQKTALKIMADNVDLQVKNILYKEVGDSGEKWEIKADLAHYIKKENLGLFDKITVTLILPDGQTLVMNGDKGRLKTDTKDMEISGNVTIVSDRGDHFKTDYLKYSHSERKLFTDAPVMVDNERYHIQGVGLTFFVQSKEIKLLSQVKAQTK